MHVTVLTHLGHLRSKCVRKLRFNLLETKIRIKTGFNGNHLQPWFLPVSPVIPTSWPWPIENKFLYEA